MEVQAPGKLVLWGEYAVLVGARAGVLAVDRYASCRLTPASDTNWQLSTRGFTSDPCRVPLSWFATEHAPAPSHPGALLWHAARANNWVPEQGGQLELDSSAFYQQVPRPKTAGDVQQEAKLGLGSSAAICTALTYLCASLKYSEGIKASKLLIFPVALAAHRAAQQGAGSGIDVAASSFGGLRSFSIGAPDRSEEPSTQTVEWPQTLHWRAFWTGSPASTTNHLKRFDAWRAKGNTAALDNLVAASEECSQQLDLTTLGQYVAALREFDARSKVGVYRQGHGDLHKLAADFGVIYKPCGAGGGDLGIAIADDPAQLQAFAAAAAANQIVQIPIEMANHGVRTQAGNHQPNT